MKQTYFLILFLSCITFNAQTDVITGLSAPRNILLNGTDLYITEFNGNKISKIDIRKANSHTATFWIWWFVPYPDF